MPRLQHVHISQSDEGFFAKIESVASKRVLLVAQGCSGTRFVVLDLS